MEPDVVYLARLHVVLFVGPILLLLAALWLGASYVSFQYVSLMLIVVALFWLVLTWVTYQFSSLTVKKKQIILRSGLLVRKTMDIPLSKVESIDIRQSIIGTIFQYGSLEITGTGGTKQFMNYLSHPLTCRRYIEQMMHEV